MNDLPLSELLMQASIQTNNPLMDFSDYSQHDCTDTGRNTGAYSIFYQCGTIDHVTHVPGPGAQSGLESDYDASCTAGMALADFRMLIDEFLNKDTYIVPEEGPLIILDIKSAVCMDKMVRIPSTQRTLQEQ